MTVAGAPQEALGLKGRFSKTPLCFFEPFCVHLCLSRSSDPPLAPRRPQVLAQGAKTKATTKLLSSAWAAALLRFFPKFSRIRCAQQRSAGTGAVVGLPAALHFTLVFCWKSVSLLHVCRLLGCGIPCRKSHCGSPGRVWSFPASRSSCFSWCQGTSLAWSCSELQGL